jgi:hypothetical protein
VSEIYGNAQIDIWDLGTGRYFKISNATSPPTVQQTMVEVPECVQTIVQTPSDDLLAEHEATWEDGARSLNEQSLLLTQFGWSPQYSMNLGLLTLDTQFINEL